MGEMHNLEVGCGDATIIISNGSYFLIDTYGIADYRHLLPNSKTIHTVFITHQHDDHFDGLTYLRDHDYHIEYLFYSPYERRRDDGSVRYDEWIDFIYLIEYFSSKGTKTYAIYRQENLSEPFGETQGLRIWILGPDRYTANLENRELHDACLVMMVESIETGRRCLFTGDASDTELAAICSITVNSFCGDIFHASHHGSINGAHAEFIQKADPAYTVISTKSGVYSNVPHPDALSLYSRYTRKKVYRTDERGTVSWDF